MKKLTNKEINDQLSLIVSQLMEATDDDIIELDNVYGISDKVEDLLQLIKAAC